MGARTSTIEIGTAVIPTWPRHPLMLAAQALTVQDAIGNRLALGIGLAHKSSVESTLKIPFATPAKHMDEYLSVLLPAMTERSVAFTGDIWSAEVEAVGGAPGAEAPPVLLAAMGPRMLRLAGERTAGSILWLSGPKAIAGRSSRRSMRPPPPPVGRHPASSRASRCASRRKPDEVRQVIAGVLAGYNDLPSYRGVMDAEGAGGPADVSIVGSEDEVRAGLAAFAEAGATDFAALEFFTDGDEITATRALLEDVASS